MSASHWCCLWTAVLVEFGFLVQISRHARLLLYHLPQMVELIGDIMKSLGAWNHCSRPSFAGT